MDPDTESPTVGAGFVVMGGDPNVAIRQEYNRDYGDGDRRDLRPEEPIVRVAGDPTLEALDALSAALAELTREQRDLTDRIDRLRRSRQSGMAWQQILSDDDPPGTMQVVSQMLARMSKASGTLRKDLVDSLRAEGTSIPAIARMFGVTHQRVSNLLRRPPD
ncbi:MAG TPA: hypothetical protein VHB02_00980 [Acidimicrobiales bacterium]|nr:hypothetical protein [Acidimicrobiales bacterium]